MKPLEQRQKTTTTKDEYNGVTIRMNENETYQVKEYNKCYKKS